MWAFAVGTKNTKAKPPRRNVPASPLTGEIWSPFQCRVQICSGEISILATSEELVGSRRHKASALTSSWTACMRGKHGVVDWSLITLIQNHSTAVPYGLV